MSHWEPAPACPVPWGVPGLPRRAALLPSPPPFRAGAAVTLIFPGFFLANFGGFFPGRTFGGFSPLVAAHLSTTSFFSGNKCKNLQQIMAEISKQKKNFQHCCVQPLTGDNNNAWKV